MSRLATLTDLGITRDQSSKWQRLASISEAVFEELVKSREPLTVNRLLRVARQYEGCETGHHSSELADSEILARVDKFRDANRFPSRAAAIRWLLDSALNRAGF